MPFGEREPSPLDPERVMHTIEVLNKRIFRQPPNIKTSDLKINQETGVVGAAITKAAAFLDVPVTVQVPKSTSGLHKKTMLVYRATQNPGATVHRVEFWGIKYSLNNMTTLFIVSEKNTPGMFYSAIVTSPKYIIRTEQNLYKIPANQNSIAIPYAKDYIIYCQGNNGGPIGLILVYRDPKEEDMKSEGFIKIEHLLTNSAA